MEQVPFTTGQTANLLQEVLINTSLQNGINALATLLVQGWCHVSRCDDKITLQMQFDYFAKQFDIQKENIQNEVAKNYEKSPLVRLTTDPEDMH